MTPSEEETVAPESGWWIAVKIGLFLAIPTALVVAIKLLMQ